MNTDCLVYPLLFRFLLGVITDAVLLGHDDSVFHGVGRDRSALHVRFQRRH